MARARTSQATRAGTSGAVVEGLDILVRDFTREADTVRDRAKRTVVAHAANAAQRMRDTVAIDQGDVLDSITADRTATVEGATVYADAGPDMDENREAFVARFLETGTVKMPPKPFVAPAGDATIPEFERDMDGLPNL